MPFTSDRLPTRVRQGPRANRIYEAAALERTASDFDSYNAMPAPLKSGGVSRGTSRGRIERNLNKNTVSRPAEADPMGGKIKFDVRRGGGTGMEGKGSRRKKEGRGPYDGNTRRVIARFSDTRY